MIQSGGFFDPFICLNKIMEPTMRVALEIPCIANSIDKGKSVPKALLDAGYNLVNSKDILSILKGSGIILPNNEIEDIMTVIRSLGNRGI